MVSLVFFGAIGYICSRAFENPGIVIWILSLAAGITASILASLYFNKNYFDPTDEQTKSLSLKNLILGLVPFFVFIPGLIAILFSVRVQLSIHGAFHLGYIYQILNGLAPPENPVLPGYAANAYWMFHALVATLSEISRTPPPLVAAFVNIGALIVSLYWIRKILGLLGLSNRNPLVTSFYSLLILFSSNLLGSMHLVLNYILNKGYSNIGFIENEGFRIMILGGDWRLVNLMRKYLNFSGFTLGVAFFIFALYISLLIAKGRFSSWNIILLAAAVSGALMFHTTTGVYALVIMPISLLLTMIITERDKIVSYFNNTKFSEILVLLVLSAFLLIPALFYTYEAASAMPAKTQIGGAFAYNLLSILHSVYPLIPLSLLGIYLYYGKKRNTILLLCIISALGCALSLPLDLPGHNQYKFIYLTVIAFSLLSLFALDYIYFEYRGRLSYLAKIVFIAVFVILSLNVILSGSAYLASHRFTDDSWYYEKGNIVMKEGGRFNDSYEWIRDNTPPDTVVILPSPSKETRQLGGKNGSLYIVSQRLPYVARGHIYAEGIDEFRVRRKNVSAFYNKSTAVETKAEILGEFEDFSKERHSVVLIPKDDIKSLSPYLNNLEMVYSGRDANLYYFQFD